MCAQHRFGSDCAVWSEFHWVQYRYQTWFFMHYHSPGQVPCEVLKTEAEGHGFQHLPRDLVNANALKTMFDPYYCIKTENIYYISRYFLHYFVSPFHRRLANIISTGYARSRAEQYTSHNGSKSVAPARSYWKLRSRALTAREMPC